MIYSIPFLPSPVEMSMFLLTRIMGGSILTGPGLRNDYKAFNNSTTWETADFSSLPAIQDEQGARQNKHFLDQINKQLEHSSHQFLLSEVAVLLGVVSNIG